MVNPGGTALGSLLALREAEERRAERALGEALAARARVEGEAARLAEAEARARSELAARRREDVAPGERAADALGRRRFWERLAADVAARAEDLARLHREALEPARLAEAAARAAHLRAHQRREVVERALARRAAARRRELERRAEAAADDRTSHPSRPSRAGPGER
jgi:hypothetical protein